MFAKEECLLLLKWVLFRLHTVPVYQINSANVYCKCVRTCKIK